MENKFFEYVMDSDKFHDSGWNERYKIVARLAEEFTRQYSGDVGKLINYFWERY